MTDPAQTDRERMVRIETILNHLSDNLRIHTEELRSHIRDETVDFRTLRHELTLHLAHAQEMRADVDAALKAMKEMDGRLTNVEKSTTKAAAWVAGAVFVVVVLWNVLGKVFAK